MSLDNDVLRQAPLFRTLDEEAASALRASMGETRLARGETLFHEGDPGDRLYIVTEGKVQKSFKVRVKRGEAVLFEGGLKNLKRFKEDVTEVKNGLDCGISLEGFDELKEGDILEAYKVEEVARTL